jgi:hypothetical protein
MVVVGVCVCSVLLFQAARVVSGSKWPPNANDMRWALGDCGIDTKRAVVLNCLPLHDPARIGHLGVSTPAAFRM